MLPHQVCNSEFIKDAFQGFGFSYFSFRNVEKGCVDVTGERMRREVQHTCVFFTLLVE